MAGGVAALGLGAVGALEYLSLGGRFDHRRWPDSTGAEAYARSLAHMARDPTAAAGSLVHVGHSTHLLSVGGSRFLTDPWFYDPAFGALSHSVGPAVSPERIGALDGILISHDHADHADPRALDRLDKRAVVVVSTRELAARVRALGYRIVEVARSWQSLNIAEVEVTPVPARHDIHEVGFVVSGGGRRVYFAGDTAFQPAFSEIAERFRLTLAILPVDGTRLIGGALHVMTPSDALRATRILGVRSVVPSHADAWLSDPLVAAGLATTIEGAGRELARAVRRSLPRVRCHVPAPGERVAIDAGVA